MVGSLQLVGTLDSDGFTAGRTQHGPRLEHKIDIGADSAVAVHNIFMVPRKFDRGIIFSDLVGNPCQGPNRRVVAVVGNVVQGRHVPFAVDRRTIRVEVVTIEDYGLKSVRGVGFGAMDRGVVQSLRYIDVTNGRVATGRFDRHRVFRDGVDRFGQGKDRTRRTVEGVGSDIDLRQIPQPGNQITVFEEDLLIQIGILGCTGGGFGGQGTVGGVSHALHGGIDGVEVRVDLCVPISRSPTGLCEVVVGGIGIGPHQSTSNQESDRHDHCD